MDDNVAILLAAELEMPGIRLLFQRDLLLQVINQWVSSVLLGSAHVAGVTVSSMTYRPFRQAFAVCNLTIEGGETERLLISFAKDRRLRDRAYAGSYSGRQRRGRALYLEEHNCLFELFPNDWQLPVLRKLYSPSHVERMLQTGGLSGYSQPALAGPPRLLTYRAHEAAVLSYDGLAAGGVPLIAKASADSARIRRFHFASSMLRRSLDGERVWTPRTFRPRREPNVLFMEHAAGTSVFEAGDPGVVLALAGEALAAIHSTPVRSRRFEHYDVQSGISHTRGRTSRVAMVSPELAERARSLLSEVEGRAQPFDGKTVFLHGDYKGTQLLLNGERVAVIDLDSTRAGDPAVDAGNFLADARREAVTSGTDLAGYETTFLEAYLRRRPSPGLEARARAFQAVALVRMAMHAFRQDAAASYRHEAQALPSLLLGEAERCLQAL